MTKEIFGMRAFSCPKCRCLNHFEARTCAGCSVALGFDPDIDGFRYRSKDFAAWRDAKGNQSDLVVCGNDQRFQICNWLTATKVPGQLCLACRHNRTIPDLAQPTVPARWEKIEIAKRRLFHELISLGLPIETKLEEGAGRLGLAFDFLYDPAAEGTGSPKIFTGHNRGVITLNLIEADDAARERMRLALREPYRTLLGHFRHEMGHYYWSRLVEHDPEELAKFREVFGDERADYQSALNAHYSRQPTPHFDADFVTAYAAMHPWEDFAETFAHYLHIVDVLATARSFDVSPGDDGLGSGTLGVQLGFNPYEADVGELVQAMKPLSFALNAINRAMGQPDLYPFHLSPTVTAKLAYIQGLTGSARNALNLEKREERIAA